jgi:hypothetical protein
MFFFFLMWVEIVFYKNHNILEWVITPSYIIYMYLTRNNDK